MPSRFDIEHVTEINAPIERVWDALIAIDNWNWNKWTKLEAKSATTGESGTLKACYKGDDEKWETFDFSFSQVSREEHLLEWSGIVAGGLLFKGKHHMKLASVSAEITVLEHKEVFSGLLPLLGLGLPYKTLDRNYLLMNKAFKAHVESPNK
jgi:hypothetical protein